MKKLLAPLICVAAMALAGNAGAATVALNFAGLNGNAYEQPLDYYNGGAGGAGSTGGVNYGISFGSSAITCTVAPTGICNSAALPTGGNLLFFLTGSGDIMNVASGFTTGFSFYYSAVNNPAFVDVYSGLNGTGTLLKQLNLPTTPNGASISGCFGTNFCPYSPIGVSFSGIARSVNFTGTANQVAFADITLGASRPEGEGAGAVPEPGAWALMLVGIAGLGMALRTRRRGAGRMALAA